MRNVAITLSLMFAASAMLAAPVTFEDPYNCGIGGANGPQCSPGSPSGINDVLGEFNKFDIQKLVITENSADALQVQIFFNYGGGNTNLKPFQVGSWLQVGDLLFDVGNDGSFDYAGVLERHGSTSQQYLPKGPGVVQKGGFYQAAGTLTADQATSIGDPSSYRPNEMVWLDPVGATLLEIGIVAVNGGHTATASQTEYETLFTVNFAGNNPLYGRDFAVQFAAATCGNDVINGVVEAETPEPATLAVTAGALITLGLFGRRRRQS